MTTSLTREEKEKFIRALEEDREFRYMLMGLLGYREILDRIIKLEERFVKLEERQQKLEERQQKLEERFAELEERFAKLEERQQRLEEELVRVRRLAELNRRDIGAITESLYSRWVWEDLREEFKSRGVVVVRRIRNYVVNGEEVDLLIETEDKIYVVEVKIQPNHHDIDDLLRKASIIKERLGKEAIPILAGVWIGDEVLEYARNKKVEVMIY
ncbi:MAG: hypothetical protein B6U89_07685 [Desulfurococcales archaeon ex4484_58]|nr:MAG: hypothetical protein B6U89_07685 [Desulfurococcales archaeon ex4484_58]